MEVALVHKLDLRSEEGKQLLKQVAVFLADTDSDRQAEFLNDFLGRVNNYSTIQALYIKESLSVEALSVVHILSGNH
jgi:hypothetical protein